MQDHEAFLRHYRRAERQGFGVRHSWVPFYGPSQLAIDLGQITYSFQLSVFSSIKCKYLDNSYLLGNGKASYWKDQERKKTIQSTRQCLI